MRKTILFALLGAVLWTPGSVGAETLDECAAEMRRRIADGRGMLDVWYPACREVQAQTERHQNAEKKHRRAGAPNPAKAADLEIRLENCLNLPNPTWEGKAVTRSWWKAHCRWFTKQLGATEPPPP